MEVRLRQTLRLLQEGLFHFLLSQPPSVTNDGIYIEWHTSSILGSLKMSSSSS